MTERIESRSERDAKGRSSSTANPNPDSDSSLAEDGDTNADADADTDAEPAVDGVSASSSESDAKARPGVETETEIESERSEESASPATSNDAEPTTASATDDPTGRSVAVSFGDGESAPTEMEAETGTEPEPEQETESPDDDLRYRTTPMLRPVVLMLGTVLVGGSIALLIPILWPNLFGDPVLAEIVLYAVAILVTVTVIRLAVRLVVLWRTQYEIREDALVRRYNLAYKRTVRKIPVNKLRGHEFSQSRYQASLGVGTIRLLTAGTNRSLGFLAFEHLKDPDTVQDHIQTLLTEREQRVTE